MERLSEIVILGGGSAGWITAGLIAAQYNRAGSNDIRVTLIESPNHEPIGVGEGTWPTLRTTLLKIGITETEFFRECDASFKQGAKFVKWVTGKEDDYYYHPLMLPQNFGKVDLPLYWNEATNNSVIRSSFSDAVCIQEAICEAGLAPKKITTAEYGSIANYAYHIDSAKLGIMLQKHCVEKLDVCHMLDDVAGVNAHENGDIKSLHLKSGRVLEGDLFVDCTGFSSLLLGQHYGVPFINKSDVLFTDTAIATHVPYEREDSPIASHTISTAQKAGWIWDIGLPTRRGVGYVYSSQHTSEDAAMAEYEKYIGDNFSKLEVRKIPITSGHRQKFWVNNCVAVGLSAGFLEPLEASALVLIELSAEFIASQLPPSRDVMDITAQRFNKIFQYRWDRIIDFLKLHYVLTKRTDSDFWIDNCQPETIPQSLLDQMELWKYRTPNDSDFDSTHEVFPAASYQYVLYGMGFSIHPAFDLRKDNAQALARSTFLKVEALKQKVLSELPTNRDLIDKVQKYGMQRV
jgi:2-polyprenyl-6-methoxyphenol hydroxylase-like FAD-dependent oxidoreductase